MEVIVPDDQLSLAIGKKGQNVRLASRLTGWRLDVRSESDAEDEARRAHRERIEGLRQKHKEDREKEEAERVRIRQKRLVREREAEQQKRDETMKDAE